MMKSRSVETLQEQRFSDEIQLGGHVVRILKIVATS